MAIVASLPVRADYILSPVQVLTDYILAFAALGLSGFFYKKANGLIKGYLLAIFIRGAFHSIGGYLYWMDYMPDSFPKSLAAIYPIAYNYSYILAEGIVTVIILLLPPVKNAMTRVKAAHPTVAAGTLFHSGISTADKSGRGTKTGYKNSR